MVDEFRDILSADQVITYSLHDSSADMFARAIGIQEDGRAPASTAR